PHGLERGELVAVFFQKISALLDKAASDHRVGTEVDTFIENVPGPLKPRYKRSKVNDRLPLLEDGDGAPGGLINLEGPDDAPCVCRQNRGSCVRVDPSQFFQKFCRTFPFESEVKPLPHVRVGGRAVEEPVDEPLDVETGSAHDERKLCAAEDAG